MLAMDELYEACTVMRHGHLSEGSVKQMCAALQRRAGADPAITPQEKIFLRQQIQQVPRAGSPQHYGIKQMSSSLTVDYLKRWGLVVKDEKYTIERFARSVASHLLDSGLSGQYIYSFIKSLLDAPQPITLQEICDALQDTVDSNPIKDFEVLLAFRKNPQSSPRQENIWLREKEVTNWLENNGFTTTDVRAASALLLTVKARDPIGAAHAAKESSDRFSARNLIATGKNIDRIPTLWVKGNSTPVPMQDASRGVSVKELDRENRIFSTDFSQSLDTALELLAHLEDSSPPAAIAGGWGAIEGLLAVPDDRASAADNLATLVTCSFARSELTALSYRAERKFPEVCNTLVGVSINRDRSKILAQMIIDNRLPEMPTMADRAAVLRLNKLFKAPHSELMSIKDSVSESFHRLYRQRNLILHGGKLDSVALNASLRTVAKLAGAGIDRITHGQYVQKLQPLDLVAKANMAICLIQNNEPLKCVDLLEVN